MVLSHSRKDAIVWSEGKDMLAWLGCHSEAFRRLGGFRRQSGSTMRRPPWSGAPAPGRDQSDLPPVCDDAALSRRRMSAAAAALQGKIERRVRDQRLVLDPCRRTWSDLENLQRWTDVELSARSEQVLTTAILDCLLHRSHVLNITCAEH